MRGGSRSEKSRRSKRPALDPAVNPLDVFAIVPGEPKFEVVEAEGKPVSADAFTAILPAKGIDSTHFEPIDSVKPLAGPSSRRVAAAENLRRAVDWSQNG